MKLCCVLVVVLPLLVNAEVHTTQSQAENITDYLVLGNKIIGIDAQGRTATVLYEYVPSPGYVLFDLEVHATTGKIYAVEGVGESFREIVNLDYSARVVEIDLHSQATRTVITGVRLGKIILSPDGSLAMLFSSTTYRVGYATRPRFQMCILDISRGACPPLEGLVPDVDGSYWMSNQWLLTSHVSDRTLIAVNALTRDREMIALPEHYDLTVFYAVAGLPYAIVSAQYFDRSAEWEWDTPIDAPIDRRFFSLDVHTLALTEINITLSEQLVAITMIEVSSNGEYLLIRGLRDNYFVHRLSTGALINQFESMFPRYGWLSDGYTLLAQILSPDLPAGLMYYDARTGQTGELMAITSPLD